MQAILEVQDVEYIPEESVDASSERLTDEEYQQGYAMRAVLLLLDDLQRNKSLDTRALQDLAAEALLWL
jgi:hypothetical protein